MDYQMIDSIMARRNLSTDPAFDNLVISIEPVPSFNGCPLGLYYPDKRTIVMPPDGLESALLHELGHRHGHYYYDDISEKYAEYFRKIYQPKGRALLYRGNHFERLSKFEVLFEELKGKIPVRNVELKLLDLADLTKKYLLEKVVECQIGKPKEV
ncbi:hypothetical protein ES705_29789 [subsurface metagenome]